MWLASVVAKGARYKNAWKAGYTVLLGAASNGPIGSCLIEGCSWESLGMGSSGFKNRGSYAMWRWVWARVGSTHFASGSPSWIYGSYSTGRGLRTHVSWSKSFANGLSYGCHTSCFSICEPQGNSVWGKTTPTTRVFRTSKAWTGCHGCWTSLTSYASGWRGHTRTTRGDCWGGPGGSGFLFRRSRTASTGEYNTTTSCFV